METLQRTANRGSVSTGYNIENSIKLETANNEWLIRASPTAGNRRKHTFSFWIKRSTLGNPSASGTGYVIGQGQHGRLFFSSDFFQYRFDDGHDVRDVTTKHRDPSAWLHVVVAVDTNQSSSSNRVKIYFNGVQTTTIDLDGGSYPDQEDQASGWFTTNYLTIGTAPFGGSYNAGDGDYDMSGYLAEFVAIDGLQLAPTEFGEYDDDSGIWKAKDVSGLTFGDEGFHLNFSNASALGEDFSGNNNDFTLSNLAAADQSTDTPTNNFCTFNPAVNFKYTTHGITEGATTFGDNTGGGVGGAFGTMAVTAGKWYWEAKLVQQVQHYLGVSAVDDGDNVLASSDPHQINSSFVFNISAARIEYIDGGSVTAGSADAFTDFHSTGAIMGIALNMDDNQISIYGNGTLQADVANTSLFDAANKMVVPLHATINDTVQYNFGGYSAWTPSSAVSDANGYGTFEYAPPSGYYSLCTKNLAEYGG